MLDLSCDSHILINPPSSLKNNEINKNLNIIKNKEDIETKISGLSKNDTSNLVSVLVEPYNVMNY